MKILYGVQGTGNGHITRARMMAQELAAAEIEVDYLFSGRPEANYFDMDCFASKQFRRGLTFELESGSIKYLRTAIKNSLPTFYQDVRSLDLSGYDCVITDFEPITAWASKKANKEVLGIGHQYVFAHDVPQQKPSFISQKVYDYFAPVENAVALHWHHFNAPILPPIIEQDETPIKHEQNLVVVYLPFESQQQVQQMLSELTDYRFLVYSPVDFVSQYPHIEFLPLSRSGFQADLHRCDAVIANAGFELSSEALNLGKRILVRPLQKQSEQLSNAIALEHLKYGKSMQKLDPKQVLNFLKTAPRVQVQFPNVAKHIVTWIKQGMPPTDHDWHQQMWQQVSIKQSEI